MIPRRGKSSKKKTKRRDPPQTTNLAPCQTKLEKHADAVRVLGRFEPRAAKLVEGARKVLQAEYKPNRDSEVYARVLGDIRRQTTPGIMMFFAATIGKQLTSHLPFPERISLVQFVTSHSPKWSCEVLDSLAVAYGFTQLNVLSLDHPHMTTTGTIDEILTPSGSTTIRQERKRSIKL